MHQLSKDLDRFKSSEAYNILCSVIQHKKVFFHYGFANYTACLTGGLRLVPEGNLRKSLEKDYNDMVQAGMFYGDPPAFGEILDRLSEVEKLLNKSVAALTSKRGGT
jgi:hypothetical protein